MMCDIKGLGQIVKAPNKGDLSQAEVAAEAESEAQAECHQNKWQTLVRNSLISRGLQGDRKDVSFLRTAGSSPHLSQ